MTSTCSSGHRNRLIRMVVYCDGVRIIQGEGISLEVSKRFFGNLFRDFLSLFTYFCFYLERDRKVDTLRDHLVESKNAGSYERTQRFVCTETHVKTTTGSFPLQRWLPRSSASVKLRRSPLFVAVPALCSHSPA